MPQWSNKALHLRMHNEIQNLTHFELILFATIQLILFRVHVVNMSSIVYYYV